LVSKTLVGVGPRRAGVKDQRIEEEIERIRQIYHQDVLAQRTRQATLLGRKCQPRILYTFLGFELQMGKKRLTCPDMSTARYLRVFAELGVQEICLPYDPSRTAIVASGLEHALDRIKECLLEQELDSRHHALALRRIYGRIRDRLRG